VDNLTGYQREHALLSSLMPRFTIGDCAAGHRAENRGKNRNVLVVPPDNIRPYLTSTVGGSSGGGALLAAASAAANSSAPEETDYVNAVFVDGYRQADEFICTEWPMSNTVGAFWSLIYDFKIRTVVVLNSHGKGSFGFPSFWPQQAGTAVKQNYGPLFCVQQKGVHKFERKFTAWDLALMKQEISAQK